MEASHVLVAGRIDGMGAHPARKRRAAKSLTARRVWRRFWRTIKFVLLVTWEVSKLLVRIAWEVFCIFLYVFLKFAFFVLRVTM